MIRKKTLLIISSILTLGIVIFLDISDRGLFYSEYIPVEELSKFYLHENNKNIQQSFKNNFRNPKYQFPRSDIKKIKVFQNILLISRLTSHTIIEKSKLEFILELFNNPDNFDWGETTWSIRESDYIFRFYNDSDEEVGIVWLCLEGCGMTKSKPFCPNMKFGGLSNIGKVRITKLLNRTINR